MKQFTLLTAAAVLVAVSLLALQEVRFRRQATALRAELGAMAGPGPVADPAADLPEAVRQLSQARSELAAAQHRLTAALQQIGTFRQQVQDLAGRVPNATEKLGPRTLAPRRTFAPSEMAEAKPISLQPGQALNRSWGEEQATGAPDTHRAGDLPTAWASRMPDGGAEWLNLEYANAVQLAEVRVRETHNPGAITKVTAVLANGQEHVIWEGVTEPTEAPVDTVFPVSGNIQAKAVKVYLDTARVPGWNEIDAVEIVGRDGVRQWASKAVASSSFADATKGVQGIPTSDRLPIRLTE